MANLPVADPRGKDGAVVAERDVLHRLIEIGDEPFDFAAGRVIDWPRVPALPLCDPALADDDVFAVARPGQRLGIEARPLRVRTSLRWPRPRS